MVGRLGVKVNKTRQNVQKSVEKNEKMGNN